MRRLTLGAAVAALLAATAGTAAAQGQPLSSGLAWDASATVLHRRLEERADDGRRLLRESGPMLRLALEGQLALSGGGAVRAGVGVAGGELDYDGQTQAGAALATDSRHRDLDITLAWRPLPAANWGEGWLVLRALQHRRDIASTASAGGLRETSTLWMPGVRWSHGFAAGSWQLRPSVELRASVDHRLEIDYGGVFDASRIEGGRRWEASLALEAAAPGSPWSWGLAWTHVEQEASARQALYRGGVAVGTVRQPRIRIDDVGVQVRRAF